MWEFENSMTMYSLTIFKIDKWTERFDTSKDLWQKYVHYIWKITIASLTDVSAVELNQTFRLF